jgi:F-type H+-transporting ATPase subunit delta
MSTDARAHGYATALFQIARAEGALEQVEEELFRFARVLENENRLREALTDPNLPPEHRVNMIGELLGNKVSPHTVNLIGFVVQSGRARDLTAIIDDLVELAAVERRQAVAEVRSAVPLDGDQRERLRSALKDATGMDVDLRVIVDPSIVGGLVAKVGDTIFDASVRRRMQEFRELMGRG